MKFTIFAFKHVTFLFTFAVSLFHDFKRHLNGRKSKFEIHESLNCLELMHDALGYGSGRRGVVDRFAHSSYA